MTPGHNGARGMIRRALGSPLWLRRWPEHECAFTVMSYPPACQVCGVLEPEKMNRPPHS